jgi:hypothetical protein
VRHRDIERFTELTGDRNLLHYDVAEELPGPGSVFLHIDCSFGPRCGRDSITAEVEVLEVRPDKPIAKLRTTITKQDGAGRPRRRGAGLDRAGLSQLGAPLPRGLRSPARAAMLR